MLTSRKDDASKTFISFHEALWTMRRLLSHGKLGVSAISQLEEGEDKI